MLRKHFQTKLAHRVGRGIVILDKEAGITSHDEVDRLRKIFGIKKVGHSGTLDPKVTGVLVCGLCRGTKVLEYVLLSEKVYDCEIIFHKKVSRANLLSVIDYFTGTISQLPPVKSRVKRVKREREVYGLELVSFADSGRSATIRCRVERGTYVRKLCHDMGEHLGVGAHMGELRRIAAGPFNIGHSKLITSSALQKYKNLVPTIFGWWHLWRLGRYVVPIEEVVVSFPRIVVDTRLAKPLVAGADLFAPGVLKADQDVKAGDLVQVVDTRGYLLMMGYSCMTGKEMCSQTEGTAVKRNKVFV